MAFPRKVLSSLILLLASLICSSRSLAESPAPSSAGIQVELVGPHYTLNAGDIAEVRVQLSAPSEATLMSAMDLIFAWDPQDLEFLGISQQGAVNLLSSYMPSAASDYTGINESSLPSDGNALYYALAPLGQPILVGSTPLLFVTLRFQVLRNFLYSSVQTVPSLQLTYPAETAVYSGLVPGATVTGNLISGVVLGSSIFTETTLPQGGSQVLPPSSNEQRVTLHQVFGCATVHAISGGGGSGGDSASMIGFLVPFVLMTLIWRALRRNPPPLPKFFTLKPSIEQSGSA